MSRRRGLGTLVRLALALVSFVLSAAALRSALRRMIVALATWLLGGVLFLAGTLFLLSATWRTLRERLRRRTPRPPAA